RRKDLLLEAESSFIDYGIEEMEEQRKVQTEQMLIDIELYKENVSKVSMDLDSNNNQGKNKEVDPLQKANRNYINKNQDISTLSETHKRRKKEDSKSPMELDINSDQDEIKPEEKLDQRTENITSMEKNLTRERVRKNLTLWDIPNGTLAQQIRKNLSYYGRATVKGSKANGKSKAVYVEVESNLEPRIKQDAGKEKILTGSNAITINRERRFGKLKENFQVNEKKSIKNHGEYVGKRKMETGNKENHKPTSSLQEQLQVNTILYEILNRLELIKNRQTGNIKYGGNDLIGEHVAHPRS
ncbi:37003_t:CDS:2, partial [Gigaspora margarita]